MKKLLASLVIACLLLAPLPAFATSLDQLPITVRVNDQFLSTDVEPYIKDGRTLLPLRAAAQALNARVSWNEQSSSATIKRGNDTLVFPLGQSAYQLNGKSYNIDIALEITDGRIMVPIRAFAEAFSVEVNWNNKIRDVQVNSKDVSQNRHLGYTNPILTDVVNKYYIAPDKNDPFIGTWRFKSKPEYSPDQETSFEDESLLFISKNDTGKYQFFEAAATHPTPNHWPDWLKIYRGNIFYNSMDEIYTFEIDLLKNFLYYDGPGYGPPCGTKYRVRLGFPDGLDNKEIKALLIDKVSGKNCIDGEWYTQDVLYIYDNIEHVAKTLNN